MNLVLAENNEMNINGVKTHQYFIIVEEENGTSFKAFVSKITTDSTYTCRSEVRYRIKLFGEPKNKLAYNATTMYEWVKEQTKQ